MDARLHAEADESTFVQHVEGEQQNIARPLGLYYILERSLGLHYNYCVSPSVRHSVDENADQGSCTLLPVDLKKIFEKTIIVSNF